jgi:hypothetical protein
MSQAELQRHIDAGVTRILPINMLPSILDLELVMMYLASSRSTWFTRTPLNASVAESPVLTGGMVPQSH